LPRHEPRVSVIIASFQWPEALRTSLQTALSQTVEDVEVLVIEDGPDQASRIVAREANDARVRWMGIRHGTGSQSGPNTLGLRQARAPVVAYLGHDDVWHPEHLARLLPVLEHAVDAAHAVTLYLGADEDRRLLIAGSRPWEPPDFVPPSSLAHWRDSPRIGPWITPDQSGMPIDYAFLMAAHGRGARFAASGSPTAFKYPAAWRLDSYTRRDATPQLRLWERLRAEPQLGQQLVRDALAGGARPVMAAPPPAPPGVIHDYGRRMKGLPARFGPRVTRWTPSAFLLFPGWHQAESDAFGSYAWTGPEERALVRLDAPGDGELGVRVVIRHALTERQLEELVVDLDGAVVAVERTAGPDGAIVMTGWLGRGPREHTVEVGLRTAASDVSAIDPKSRDKRVLGVAVSEIALLCRDYHV
jgi:glycosyltransferase involved in cell wall biosynthesis